MSPYLLPLQADAFAHLDRRLFVGPCVVIGRNGRGGGRSGRN